MAVIKTIKDETLTALGDAIRSKVIGTSEIPVLSVEKQMINYNTGYPYSLSNQVKKVKITGFITYSSPEEVDGGYEVGNSYGVYGLGMAEGSFNQYGYTLIRNHETYKVLVEGYNKETIVPSKTVEFETIIEGNQWAFISSINDSNSEVIYLTFTAVGLDENGNEYKYTPLEMVDKINELDTIPPKAFNIAGDCSYRFAYNSQNWLIEAYGDKITTSGITTASNMFNKSKTLKTIPFDINFDNNKAYTDNMFGGCEKLTEIPQINNLTVHNSGSMFNGCYNLRNFPDGLGDNWDFSYANTNTVSFTYLFANCYSLRKIPSVLNRNLFNKSTYSSSSCYRYRFYYCYSLDEIIDLCVSPATYTTNMFDSAFMGCNRVKDLTFITNEDGTPKTANWKKQTLVASGFGSLLLSSSVYVLNYNSGITADKEVKDDTTYQALKNDPDWFSCDVNYSRYNHDSAVRTINSLPDCSAYLATQSGTSNNNTISFKGAAGSKTDGGAINTLTEEEIAVAAAKGWTVSLV